MYSVQEFMQSPSSKLGQVFNSSIMGPKRIKQVTVVAPAINCQDNRKYNSPLPSVNNGKSTDANDRKDPQGGSNIDGNGHKCLVNLINHNGLLA